MHKIFIIVVELSYREIVVALPTLMIIAVVFGAICMQRRNKKDKKTNMRYVHFEVSLLIKYTRHFYALVDAII